MQKKKGISLIVLVMTIIVMIILASTIIISLNNNGVIEKSKEAVFKTNAKNYQQEISVYLSNILMSNPKYDIKNLNATDETTPNITDIITSMKEEDKIKFKIIAGNLFYSGIDKDEIKWCKEIGLKITSYTSSLTEEEYNAIYSKEIATALTEGDYYINGGEWAERLPGFFPADTNVYVLNSSTTEEDEISLAIPYGTEIVYADWVYSGSGYEYGEQLYNIVFPPTVKKILFNSDIERINLKNIILPEGVTEFSAKTVQEIYIPASMENFDCKVLNAMDGPNVVDGNIWMNSSKTQSYVNLNAEELTITEDMTSSGIDLSECNKLKRLTIPGTFGPEDFGADLDENAVVKLTGKIADLNRCNGSYTVVLSKEIENITGTMYDNLNLTLEEGGNFIIDDDIIYNKDKTELLLCNRGKHTKVNIPDTVKTIHDYAFAYCNFAGNLIIPEGVESIGSGAFVDCYSKDIVIPNSVKTMGSGLFDLVTGCNIYIESTNFTIKSFGGYNASYTIYVRNAEIANSLAGKYGEDCTLSTNYDWIAPTE